MSVELDPPELGFKREYPPSSLMLLSSDLLFLKGPFTSEVSEVLRLRNPHSDPVAFKVKTTAPKQYVQGINSTGLCGLTATIDTAYGPTQVALSLAKMSKSKVYHYATT